MRLAKEYGVPLASGTDYISRTPARQEPRGADADAPGRAQASRRRCSSRRPAAPSSAACRGDYGRIEPGYVFDAIVLDERPGRSLALRRARRRRRRLPGRPADRAAPPAHRVLAVSESETHVELRGISQALRRRPRALRRRPRGSSEAVDPRARRRERRRQVDAREDHRRRPPARRRRAARRGPRASHYRSPRDALVDGITMIAQELDARPAPHRCSRTSSSASRRSRRGRRRPPRDCAPLRRARRGGRASSCRPRRLARSLRVADQQKVEILRAIARDARLIVMDEPTSALTLGRVGAAVRARSGACASRGTTIVYVSHFLAEVLEVADTVTVLRDGRVVQHRRRPRRRRPQRSCSAMLGRSIELDVPGEGAAGARRAGRALGPRALAAAGGCRTSRSRSAPARSSASPG